MTTNRFANSPTFVELVSDIASGAKDLANAHGQQLKEEVKTEVNKAKTAIILLALGSFLALAGGAFLMIALVNVLIEVAQWPAWASWLTVGGVIFVGGVVAIVAGISVWNSFRAVPDRTLRSIQESLSWISK